VTLTRDELQILRHSDEAPPLPAQLRVGHAVFQVRSDRDVCAREQTLGSTHGDSRSIIVDEAMNPDLARQVLLHELLHAVVYVSGYRFDDDDAEERAVAALTGPLLSTLRDNPDLAPFLLASDI